MNVGDVVIGAFLLSLVVFWTIKTALRDSAEALSRLQTTFSQELRVICDKFDTLNAELAEIKRELQGRAGAVGPLMAIKDELQGRAGSMGPLIDIRRELAGDAGSMGPLMDIRVELQGDDGATGPLMDIKRKPKMGSS